MKTHWKTEPAQTSLSPVVFVKENTIPVVLPFLSVKNNVGNLMELKFQKKKLQKCVYKP